VLWVLLVRETATIIITMIETIIAIGTMPDVGGVGLEVITTTIIRPISRQHVLFTVLLLIGCVSRLTIGEEGEIIIKEEVVVIIITELTIEADGTIVEGVEDRTYHHCNHLEDIAMKVDVVVVVVVITFLDVVEDERKLILSLLKVILMGMINRLVVVREEGREET
jgi:hypothetical protein